MTVEDQPITTVEWVDPESLRANGYNPNHVAPPEMRLLKLSIMETGWTQPIVVRDHGTGLRPGESSLVFNRFWRADPSRVRSIGGTGLGLPIALEDARLHGGWLQAWGAPSL